MSRAINSAFQMPSKLYRLQRVVVNNTAADRRWVKDAELRICPYGAAAVLFGISAIADLLSGSGKSFAMFDAETRLSAMLASLGNN
jgi:hypothetical protein